MQLGHQPAHVIGLVIVDHRLGHLGHLLDQNRDIVAQGKVKQDDNQEIGQSDNQFVRNMLEFPLDEPDQVNDQVGKDKGEQDRVHHRPHIVQGQNDHDQDRCPPQVNVVFKSVP